MVILYKYLGKFYIVWVMTINCVFIYILTIAQGHTVRGCLSPATRTTCVADALCEPCPAVAGIGTGCNNVVFI